MFYHDDKIQIYLWTPWAGVTPRLDTTDLIIGTEGRKKGENIRLILEINTHFLQFPVKCGYQTLVTNACS